MINIFGYKTNDIELVNVQNIIKYRITQMKQSPKKVVTSVTLNILRSIRAMTKKAKLSGIDVDVSKDSNLMVRYSGSLKKNDIYTVGNARYTKKSNEIKVWNGFVPKAKNYVYRCELPFSKNRKIKNMIIVAPDGSTAKRIAKEYVKNRIKRYRGLAKLAISKLMMNVYSSAGTKDDTSKEAQKIADTVTKVRKISVKDGYSIDIKDGLEYAKNALKTGDAGLQQAINSAVRKMEGQIKHKMEHALSYK